MFFLVGANSSSTSENSGSNQTISIFIGNSMRKTLAVLVTSIALTCVMAAQASFSGSTYSAPSSSNQFRTTVADLDRDGNPDLITTDSTGGSLLIRYGIGSGKFGSPQKVALAGGLFDVKAADFNNDGTLDLAVSNQDAQNISIVLNHGSRSYSVTNFAVGGIVSNLAVGDFNRDGKIDIAAVVDGAIKIYLGNGNGTFTPGASLSASANLELFSLDLNKDGKLDLLAVNTGGAQVLLGNGSGTFTLGQKVSISGLASFVSDGATGDLNGDAVADLVLTAYSNSTSSPMILTYLNNGSGQFTLKQQLKPAGQNAAQVAVGDINQDGKADLVYVDTANSSDQFAYAIGRGDGTFQTPVIYAPTVGPQQVLLHDLNNDGRYDVVFTETSNLRVFLNTTGTVDCSSPNSSKLAVHVCAPTSGATEGSPFSVRAVANAPSDVLRIEEWVDGSKLYQTLSNQLRNSLTLSAGSHTLTVVAIDLFGRTAKQSVSFTVDSTGCSAPSGAGVRICSPLAGSSVKSPVQFSAAATAASGTHITAMRLYIDYKSAYTVNSAQLSTSLSLASGSHHVTVVAYESNGASLKTSETITVQ